MKPVRLPEYMAENGEFGVIGPDGAGPSVLKGEPNPDGSGPPGGRMPAGPPAGSSTGAAAAGAPGAADAPGVWRSAPTTTVRPDSEVTVPAISLRLPNCWLSSICTASVISLPMSRAARSTRRSGIQLLSL